MLIWGEIFTIGWVESIHALLVEHKPTYTWHLINLIRKPSYSPMDLETSWDPWLINLPWILQVLGSVGCKSFWCVFQLLHNSASWFLTICIGEKHLKQMRVCYKARQKDMHKTRGFTRILRGEGVWLRSFRRARKAAFCGKKTLKSNGFLPQNLGVSPARIRIYQSAKLFSNSDANGVPLDSGFCLCWTIQFL